MLTFRIANENIRGLYILMRLKPGSMRNNNKGGVERRLEIVLESKVESADAADSLIHEFAGKEYGEQGRHQISLAVREAMANAVLHGNRFDASKKIFLSAAMHRSSLVISIRDEGNGCEPESVPDPLAAENILRDSGRGMLLIRACMDEVTWRRAPSGGTEIIMTKRVPTPN